MSLGWGWRGYIGGGPFGAMIPGAMAALMLCRMLGLDPGRSALAAAFAAVGVGFGGEMTYGQTVGFVREPETFGLGLAGLALKGGVWGLLGGAFVGAGFHLASGRRGRLLPALGGMVAACAAGWALINRPKLIYFSNLADRPREEVWAGLLFGAIAFLVVYGWGDAGPIGRFALGGSLGGFFGFGLGGCWMFVGAQTASAPDWVPWWKFMEFTFGFLFGAGLGWAADRERDWLKPVGEIADADPPRIAPWAEAALTAAAAAGIFLAEPFLGLRFNFVVIGALLAAAAAYLPSARWPIAVAVTAAAFFLDWFDYVLDEPPFGSIRLGASITAVAVVSVCAILTSLRRRGGLHATSAFWLLTVAAMLTSWARVVLLGEWDAGGLSEHVCFLGLLAVIVAWERSGR